MSELAKTENFNINNAASLREARFVVAVKHSDDMLAESVNLDFLSENKNSLMRIDANVMCDSLDLPMGDLISLDALGVDLNFILAQTGNENVASMDLITTVDLPHSVLEISKLAQGVTYYIEQDSPTSAPLIDKDFLRQKIHQRYSKSPAYQAFAGLKSRLEEADGINGSIETEQFDPYLDPLSTCQVPLLFTLCL